GVTVNPGGTIEDLARATHAPDVRVVAVMGHWTGNAIELADGCHSPQRIAKVISPEFDGIIHLCVCDPLEAARFLDRTNERVLVHFGQQPADPSVWMVYL